MEIEFEGTLPLGAGIAEVIEQMMGRAMQQRVDHRTVGIVSNVYGILNAKEPEDRSEAERAVMRFIEMTCHVTKVTLGMCGAPDPNEPMHREEHITELRIQAIEDYERYTEQANDETKQYTNMVVEGINESV